MIYQDMTIVFFEGRGRFFSASLRWLPRFLFFGDFDDFAFLVIAAMGTGAMRHSQFVTIGTLGKRARRQVIVSATAIAACFGVSTFWIRHSLRTPVFQPPLDFKQRVQIWIELLFRTVAALQIQIRPALGTQTFAV